MLVTSATTTANTVRTARMDTPLTVNRPTGPTLSRVLAA